MHILGLSFKRRFRALVAPTAYSYMYYPTRRFMASLVGHLGQIMNSSDLDKPIANNINGLSHLRDFLPCQTIQVVIEDYIHTRGFKLVLLTALNTGALAGALAGVLSIFPEFRIL